MAFFNKGFFSCHFSTGVRFIKCTTNSCHVNRFDHLNCGSSIFKACDFFFNNITLLKCLQKCMYAVSVLFHDLHAAVCLLMFSKKPRRPSQNSCIHTKIKLHKWAQFIGLRKKEVAANFVLVY